MPAKKKFPPPNAKQGTPDKSSAEKDSGESLLSVKRNASSVEDSVVKAEKDSVVGVSSVETMEVSDVEPEGLYRSIQINAEEKTFSKEQAQVASVMTNIFSNLKDLSSNITLMFRSFTDDIISNLNIRLNQDPDLGLETVSGRKFIVFGPDPSASGQDAKKLKTGVLYITNKKPEPPSDKQRQAQAQKSEKADKLIDWLEANGEKSTRETLDADETSYINAILLFYSNLYNYEPQSQPIILRYFTTILSSLLSKGYSDSAIFLEAAKQKFVPGPGQELSVNICQSSDKLASLLGSYINGFALGIRKTPKSQDAYITIMDEGILRFLVGITRKQILFPELEQMLSELHAIGIDGIQLVRGENTNEIMIPILRGIRDLKIKMQQTLLQKGRLGPEDILNLSFEELAKQYVNYSGQQIFSDHVKIEVVLFLRSVNPDPQNKNYIEFRIIQNYFTLKKFSQQMRVAFLPPPSEKELAPMDVSSSSEAVQASQKAFPSSSFSSEVIQASQKAFPSSLKAEHPPQKAFPSSLKAEQPSKKAFSSSSEAVQPPGRQFYSFLLVLFFEAFPNLKDIGGQQFKEEAQHRAIFSAFYDFLNGHDFKIKNLLYVFDIVLPEFFTPFEKELLRNVSNYHEDEEAIHRFSGANGKVTFLLNALMSETQFTYYDNANNLLNSSITDDMIRTGPTLELFELVPCATRVTSFNDFKVGKEVAGPQLNTLKSDIILSIRDYVRGNSSCESAINPDDCVDYVMRHVFFRVTDAITLVSMFDSGSPPLFAAKYLIGDNPERDRTRGLQNNQQIIISTGDTALIVEEYKRDPLLPTKELIKEFYVFLTGGILQNYPDVLILSEDRRMILLRMLPDYQNWFDQWRYYLFLQLKTDKKNELAVGKKRSFLVSLANKYINQNPPILLDNQMQTKGYTQLREFFQRMQGLSEQVKLTKSKKSGKLLPQTQEDLTDYNENPDVLYRDFFTALFDAFGRALGNSDHLNTLFQFISLFVDDGPKSMDEVRNFKNIKDEINGKMRQRTQHCEKLPGFSAQGPRSDTSEERRDILRAQGFTERQQDIKLWGNFAKAAVTPKKGTQESKMNRWSTMSIGGSRRRKNKYYKTKRIKHAHKYKKLTKKRRVKKHKTKKYNRHKK
jgi:hypothetical protein